MKDAAGRNLSPSPTMSLDSQQKHRCERERRGKARGRARIRQMAVVGLFTGLPTASSIECAETSRLRTLASNSSGEPIGVSRRVRLTRELTRNLRGTPTRGLTPRGSPGRDFAE
jgi:hypothetical protein